MTDFKKLMEDSPYSLDDVLCDEPQPDEQHEIGQFEAKLETLRANLVEKHPMLKKLIGDVDISIGISQGIGQIVPAIVASYMLLTGPAGMASYAAIMAARWGVSVVSTAATYFGVHYLMNENYRGKKKELLKEAVRFTSIERFSYIPLRLLSLAAETSIIGGLGVVLPAADILGIDYENLSQFLIGMVVQPIVTTYHGFANNISGGMMQKGESVLESVKRGFYSLPREILNMAAPIVTVPYHFLTGLYDRITDKEEPLPYPLDLPEEYIADWHASMTANRL